MRVLNPRLMLGRAPIGLRYNQLRYQSQKKPDEVPPPPTTPPRRPVRDDEDPEKAYFDGNENENVDPTAKRRFYWYIAAFAGAGALFFSTTLFVLPPPLGFNMNAQKPPPPPQSGPVPSDPSSSSFIPRTQAEAPSIAQKDSLQIRESGVTASSPMRLRMQALIQAEQQKILAALNEIDPTAFRTDGWQRPDGGGGISCVLQDGTVFEKAGVNTSVVYGVLPRPAILKMRANHKNLDPDVAQLDFFAAGLSLVIHPKNPMVPTVHLNYRYFETAKPDGSTDAWWFGGGTDLTPSYLFDDDATHFHRTIKSACDRHDTAYYARFKRWCDTYFSVKHRGEARGVGGIFFDDLDGAEDKSPEQLFGFVTDCLRAFPESYLPIVRRRMDLPFDDAQRRWQQLRRGRYVEFNLVHDRGTSFGLNTPGARIESILMSLPLTSRWEYMHEPEAGSEEERLIQVLREPVDWV